jgi:hypothetical protein
MRYYMKDFSVYPFPAAMCFDDPGKPRKRKLHKILTNAEVIGVHDAGCDGLKDEGSISLKFCRIFFDNTCQAQGGVTFDHKSIFYRGTIKDQREHLNRLMSIFFYSWFKIGFSDFVKKIVYFSCQASLPKKYSI